MAEVPSTVQGVEEPEETISLADYIERWSNCGPAIESVESRLNLASEQLRSTGDSKIKRALYAEVRRLRGMRKSFEKIRKCADKVLSEIRIECSGEAFSGMSLLQAMLATKQQINDLVMIAKATSLVGHGGPKMAQKRDELEQSMNELRDMTEQRLAELWVCFHHVRVPVDARSGAEIFLNTRQMETEVGLIWDKERGAWIDPIMNDEFTVPEKITPAQERRIRLALSSRAGESTWVESKQSSS